MLTSLHITHIIIINVHFNIIWDVYRIFVQGRKHCHEADNQFRSLNCWLGSWAPIASIKVGSHYDALQRVRKNRTNFYSSVVVQMGMRRHASVGNGSEPASSELRDATRHTVNQP